MSAFALEDGVVYHTYSTYERGTDALVTTYKLLGWAPRGRDEEGFSYPMAWLRRHDEYPKGPREGTRRAGSGEQPT